MTGEVFRVHCVAFWEAPGDRAFPDLYTVLGFGKILLLLMC